MSLKEKMASRIASDYYTDPLKGFVFIYGEENTTTTTLALSIVKALPPDKKAYVLLTEPPYNVTGIIEKHYKEFEDRFVFTTYKGTVMPVTTYTDYEKFLDEYVSSKDGGALIVDAIDTLVNVLFMKYEKENKLLMDAWGKTYGDIIKNLFMRVNSLGRPTVIVMKEKEKIIVERVGRKVEVTSTGEIVPTLSSERIQRWATTRLRMLKKGHYVVMKSKGRVKEGEKFKFNEKLEGVLLPELLKKMVGEGD